MYDALIDEHLANHTKALESVDLNRKILAEVSQACAKAVEEDKTIYWLGNGGSAADSQHMATELVVAFKNRERRPIRSEALTCDTSTLTAAANDFGFDHVFERQIMAKVTAGDVVIGISTSWKSQNVILAMKKAQEIGAVTIGFAGDQENTLNLDYWLGVKCKGPAVQEMHEVYGHLICGFLEHYVEEKNGKR